jgi:RNA polymerase subunit RPABC4/transcription elongation factor Spt4
MDEMIRENPNLIHCYQCGGLVSREAKVCPHCGGNPVYGREQAEQDIEKWDGYGWIVFLAIVVPIAGLICGIYGLSKKKVGSNSLVVISVVAWVFYYIFIMSI